MVLVRIAARAGGYRQEDLAARLGTQQSRISRLTSGQSRLSILEAKSLCDLAGITLDQSWARHDRLLRVATDMQRVAVDAGEVPPSVPMMMCVMAEGRMA